MNNTLGRCGSVARSAPVVVEMAGKPRNIKKLAGIYVRNRK